MIFILLLAICQVRLDFKTTTSLAQPTVAGCATDTLTITAEGTTTLTPSGIPVLCGTLTGQHGTMQTSAWITSNLCSWDIDVYRFYLSFILQFILMLLTLLLLENLLLPFPPPIPKNGGYVSNIAFLTSNFIIQDVKYINTYTNLCKYTLTFRSRFLKQNAVAQ